LVAPSFHDGNGSVGGAAGAAQATTKLTARVSTKTETTRVWNLMTTSQEKLVVDGPCAFNSSRLSKKDQTPFR
jgi:hypothetical protein